eukprot:3685277-Rhodomonas_salina.1
MMRPGGSPIIVSVHTGVRGTSRPGPAKSAPPLPLTERRCACPSRSRRSCRSCRIRRVLSAVLR